MLQTILNTKDFSEWEVCMASSVGSHYSHLHDKGTNFSALIQHARTGDLDLLHLQGSGRLELERTQAERPLLWIPLQGTIEERVNGDRIETSPGSPLLFRPGDQMIGHTSEWIEGFSVLLPADTWITSAVGHGCEFDPRSGQRLTMLTLQLARAFEHGYVGPDVAAEALLYRIEQQFIKRPTVARSGQRRRRRRWEIAMEATHWMQERLHQPFTIEDLAVALNTPKRTIQAAFVSSLGRPPLAQARLLRLRALRSSLQDTKNNGLSVAELMQQQGLSASGRTAASYRYCFGEVPSQTRSKAGR